MSEWIKVADRLPEDDAPSVYRYSNEQIDHADYLCRYLWEDEVFYGTLTYDNSSGIFFAFYMGERFYPEVTHWMPLPEPPKD